MYGYAGCWCWILIDPLEKFWGNFLRIIQFEIFLWFALIYNFYWYIRCIRFLKKLYRKQVNRGLLVRLFFYPMVLVFCWSWMTINRIYNIFGENSSTLNILQIVFVSFEGLFNAIIYGLNRDVKNCLKEKIFGIKTVELVDSKLINDDGNMNDVEMSDYLDD